MPRHYEDRLRARVRDFLPRWLRTLRGDVHVFTGPELHESLERFRTRRGMLGVYLGNQAMRLLRDHLDVVRAAGWDVEFGRSTRERYVTLTRSGTAAAQGETS